MTVCKWVRASVDIFSLHVRGGNRSGRAAHLEAAEEAVWILEAHKAICNTLGVDPG